MFESQNRPATDPFVLRMTGGPGCASTLALFAENGPYKVNSDLSIRTNIYSWNKFANLLYVDQPVGTGFSYVKSEDGYVDDEAEVDAAMYQFLQLFFAKYPRYATLPFFIVGESYGGHYVPSLSAYIMEANKRKLGKVFINQKGMGVGDGWISPIVQYGAYAPFSLMNGLINFDTSVLMDRTYARCRSALTAKDWDEAGYICPGIMQTVLDNNPDINVYDIRKKCNGPLCYNFTAIGDYLNIPSVQRKLGVIPFRQWAVCSYSVNERFAVDLEESFRFDIPKVLAAGYRVMLYSGDKDLICNYVGGIKLLTSMPWPGLKAWVGSKNVTWHVDGEVAGWAKAAQGLTWVQVHNAGHMVPMDQPKNALDMLNRLLNNLPF